MRKNVKIKYLNWDGEKGDPKLSMNLLDGDIADLTKDYRVVNEYESYEEIQNEKAILNLIYEEHNRIDDEHLCRLEYNQRSMCVGDLIRLEYKWYVVRPFGFESIE